MQQKFKIRASASGSLTSLPRSKKARENGELSKTVETFAQDWLKESIYGVKKDFSSKYTEKGNLMEDSAIEMAIKWLDLPLLTQKNEQYFEDEYFTGTPDLILDDEVLDIKCSWDCFTFPLFEDELPDKAYYYQLQVYMHLTGKKKARIVYVLMNTPKKIANWEEKHDYSNIDSKYRIKTYDVVYNAEDVQFLKDQVQKVRMYINNLNK